jgi:serine/threonine protein kinase/tetratricopeptide (TPR) repeat protein
MILLPAREKNARAVALNAPAFRIVLCNTTRTGVRPMSSRESEAARIFLDAVEHPEDSQRADFIRDAAAGDQLLLQRVDALLKAHGEPNQMLDGNRLAPTVDAPQPAEEPGTLIGPYKLLEQIGEGGMGLVFMAEQTRPVRRKVALKVLKPGLDTRQVVARFEAERQALALMDHPNIAKIHDGGATAGGRPYFVMELVRGVAITEFCDQRRLTTRQRLELFMLVCQAAQHAHQKGIIHRDLKPSNVLVTLHDTVAVPKVIDFGIAKATTGPLTERTLFTHFAQMVGTPLYMSPEQAEMNGLDVDTRSDVYSLGVLLYELLTGTTPFASEKLKKAGLDEMRRLIREEEPPTPSQRLHTLDAQACSTVSERRGVDGRRLGQLLRGELDWIAMRALEKDRERRYESASAFAADVQRYLADEAVAACPPSAGYRLRKYVRRNRRALVIAGTFAAVLVAATAVSTWQAVVARDAQHQAERDRDRAMSAESQAKTEQARAQAAEAHAATEAAIARAVNDFLQGDLLGQVASAPPQDREFAEGPYLTVKEALDRAEARIGQRFQNQPLVEAAIRMTIGEACLNLSDQARPVKHFKRAFALRKTHLGPADPNTLRSMQALSGAYLWAGQHSESIALRQQLLEERKARLGPYHPEVLDCMAALAGAYRWARQLETSRQLHEQVLEKRRILLGPTHPATLDTMTNLARVHDAAGRFEEAIDLYTKILELLKVTKDPRGEWPSFGTKTELARSCIGAGKFAQADRLLREVRQYHQNRPDSHERRVFAADQDGWLALSLVLQKRYAEAEPLARQAAAVYGRDAPNTGRRFWYEGVLGAALLGQQKYTEAEPILLQAYQGMKRWERMSPQFIRGLAEVGGWIVQFYEATNQPEKAREWQEKLKPKPPDAASAGAK